MMVHDHALREFRADLNREVLLGTSISGAGPCYLSLDDLKQTSVHVVGAAGYGKSFYLRHLINQFVLLRQPFGVIDPHRELYEYALWRLRRSGVRADRIVLLDPGDTRYALGFNPLACGVPDAAETASMVLEAFLKAWGAASFDQTPRLEWVLRGMFRLLIDNNLTLLEGYDLLNVDNVGVRRLLGKRVTDPFVRQDFEEFEKFRKAEKLALVESSRNRLRRVIQAPALQWMLAQAEHTVDLRAVLDEGKFLLANLGSISAPETQRLIGALLMNGLFHAAKRRNSRRRRSWFLICDEVGEFVTQDFANSLDQLRKFGLHVIAAHQRLGQLEREDSEVLSAMMTNAKVKVIFGGLQRSDAERMAREVFTGDVAGNRVKHVTRQTKFRPVFDTFEVEGESHSDTDTDSETWGESQGTTVGSAEGDGESWVDEVDNRFTHNRSRSSQTSASDSHSSGGSRASAQSRGYSRSRVPITRHEEFAEETSRQFYSLDEEWERYVAQVHQLGKREALVKVYNNSVQRIRTPTLEPEHTDQRLERFQTKVMVQCRYTKPVAAVVRQIEARRKELAAALTDAARLAHYEKAVSREQAGVDDDIRPGRRVPLKRRKR